MGVNFVGDFETTTTEDNCHVWAWALCEVGNPENLYIGADIYDFMGLCEELIDNIKVYFHNLKFDGQFIISWLFENGYTHITKADERESRTFKTMISDKGLYYSIEVIFYKNGKNINKVTFFDSAKLFPNMGVDDIAKAFHMPISKLKIDYTAHDNLPYGSPLTKEEKDYIINDVRIVSNALNEFHSKGMDKITIGSCAMAEYKKLVGDRTFRRWFPVLPAAVHEDIKQSYKGGWTYLNPKFAGKTVGRGFVLDVNSLFPSVMKKERLPWGTPVFFEGEYEPDPIYPLYTQMIQCQFELKPGKIPTIQIKSSDYFMGNEYLTSSNGDSVVLVLNSVDLELFLEQYEVYNIEYLSGWKFRAQRGMFDAFIDKWTKIKIESAQAGNWGMYLIAKLMLNSLYGKFGTNTTRRSKIPYMGDDGKVHYKDTDPISQEGVYVAVASFITSYARAVTIRAAQKVTDNYNQGKSKAQFAYGDTDSMHILSESLEMPEGIEIDKYQLGAWKLEAEFTRAKFLRQKCYIETHIITEEKYREGISGKNACLYSKEDGGYRYLKITVAGMPSDCYSQVNYQNFKITATYEGKKQPKIVPGGVVLKGIDFTIKG